MRFRDADEAVHDAPDGAEQSDEGRGRADGGENARAARQSSPDRRLDAFDRGGKALPDPFSISAVGRPFQLHNGGAHELGGSSADLNRTVVRLGQRSRPCDGPMGFAQSSASKLRSSSHLGERDRPRQHRGEREPDHHRFD